jgi:hypothetical protein
MPVSHGRANADCLGANGSTAPGAEKGSRREAVREARTDRSGVRSFSDGPGKQRGGAGQTSRRPSLSEGQASGVCAGPANCGCPFDSVTISTSVARACSVALMQRCIEHKGKARGHDRPLPGLLSWDGAWKLGPNVITQSFGAQVHPIHNVQILLRIFDEFFRL